MQSAKSLKSIAVNNPRRIGRTENLRAVKHHLLRSDGTEQAFAADAIVKLANADPHAAQKLRGTLEQPSSERHQPRVNERVDRAVSHIESQINTPGPPYADQLEERTTNQDENTQIYHQQQSTTDANYCAVCGTELPATGPANYCPGCGAEVS